jgi:hypothetical protein
MAVFGTGIPKSIPLCLLMPDMALLDGVCGGARSGKQKA